MRRFLALLLALVTVLALTACDRRRSRSKDDDDDDDEETTESAEQTDIGSDVIVDDDENSGSTAVVRPLPDNDDEEETTEETEEIEETESEEALKSPVEILFGDAGIETHTVQEMTIELPDTMWEDSNENYTALFDSSLAAIYVLREDFNTAGINSSWTAEEYAEAVIAANSSYDYSSIGSGGNGWVTTEYATGDFHFCCAMYKGDNAFWFLQFVCREENLEELVDYFEVWLDSVEFN